MLKTLYKVHSMHYHLGGFKEDMNMKLKELAAMASVDILFDVYEDDDDLGADPLLRDVEYIDICSRPRFKNAEVTFWGIMRKDKGLRVNVAVKL